MLELNNDQRREIINTRQRFEALVAAKRHLAQFRGSMVWSSTKGVDYLLRSHYETGPRRQKSLGPRSSGTETLKLAFDKGRVEARRRVAVLGETLDRQAGVNRALGLGRVPLLSANILRALDERGLLGGNLRLVGTNVLYAYEAAAGVHVDAELAATQDIDLLLDSRAALRFVAASGLTEGGIEAPHLLHILKRIDQSFVQGRESFRAVNQEGYFVDLIKPMRDPPWISDREQIGGTDQAAADDLKAVEIEGLVWLESAPAFEAVAIDERGYPLRLVCVDPRVFAAHKLWVSRQPSRNPVQRVRDAAQARVVGKIVKEHMPHLPFDTKQLRMLPQELVDQASSLFGA